MFNSNTEILKYNIKNIFLKYLVEIVRSAKRRVIIIVLPTIYNNTVKDFKCPIKARVIKKRFNL